SDEAALAPVQADATHERGRDASEEEGVEGARLRRSGLDRREAPGETREPGRDGEGDDGRPRGRHPCCERLVASAADRVDLPSWPCVRHEAADEDERDDRRDAERREDPQLAYD